MAFLFLLVQLSLLGSNVAHSKGIYQTAPEFIAENFQSSTPQVSSLWLTPELKSAASTILNPDQILERRRKNCLDHRRNWQRITHYHWCGSQWN